MNFVKRVLVVGGGIGGMSAALCLRKLGSKVDLVEIDPAWKVYGAGITITGASLRAFADLGVLKQLARDGHVAGGVRLHALDGTLIMHQPPYSDELIHAGAGIMRPQLHAILSTATREAGVRVRLGVSVERLDQFAGHVSVELSDGERADYDLVVAADGIFSKLRRMLFPEAAAPHFTGQGCWRLVTDRPERVTCASMYLGGPHPMGFVPVSATQMYMFVLEHVPGNPRIEPAHYAQRLRGLMKGYEGFAGQVREKIVASSSIVYRPLEALFVPSPWYKGRVLLLGDAAHATTPHLATGAGMAVEDALVLADELSKAHTLEAALAAHMARRFERTRTVVENSVQVGQYQIERAPADKSVGLMQATGAVLAQPY